MCPSLSIPSWITEILRNPPPSFCVLGHLQNLVSTIYYLYLSFPLAPEPPVSKYPSLLNHLLRQHSYSTSPSCSQSSPSPSPAASSLFCLPLSAPGFPRLSGCIASEPFPELSVRKVRVGSVVGRRSGVVRIVPPKSCRRDGEEFGFVGFVGIVCSQQSKLTSHMAWEPNSPSSPGVNALDPMLSDEADWAAGCRGRARTNSTSPASTSASQCRKAIMSAMALAYCSTGSPSSSILSRWSGMLRSVTNTGRGLSEHAEVFCCGCW